MRHEEALAALMAGHRVLMRGGGPIAKAVEQRLEALDVPVVREQTSATDAIVTWEPAPVTPEDLGGQIQQLTALLDRGSLRRVLLVAAGDEAVAARVAETLTIYAAAHLVQRQTRFNLLRLPVSATPAAVARASNTMLMLLCGRMDAVHGQVLTVTEPDVSQVRA